MNKSILKTLTAASLSLLVLAACGSNDQQAANESSTSKAEKESIVVATSGSPKPFTYVNEKNEPTGYDIELIKALFKELPEYEVSFEVTEFTSVLAGLDTNRYQIGANNFAMNEERKEKYIYSDPIFENQYSIAVPKDVNDVASFADLHGQSTEVSPGLNYATALENYNKENPDAQVELNYSETDLLTVLQNVESGRFDFQLIDKAMGQQYIDEHKLDLKLVDLSAEDGERIGTPYSYLLISRGQKGEALTEKINTALKTIIANGTVSKISEEFLGGDFAPKE